MAAGTTARKSAPKKAARKTAPKPASQAWGDGLEPVQIGEGEPEPVEMRTLFVLDGTEYKVPAKPEPRLGLRFIRESRDPKIGSVEALARLTVDFLGEDNLRALEESPKTTAKNIADVFSIVQKIVLGATRKASDPS